MKLPACAKLKPSGVEWLGDLLEYWEMKCQMRPDQPQIQRNAERSERETLIRPAHAPTGHRPKAQGWTEERGPTLGNECPIGSPTPTGLRPGVGVRRRDLTQPRWGWDLVAPMTQGSSFLATLGFEAESLWDSRQEVAA